VDRRTGRGRLRNLGALVAFADVEGPSRRPSSATMAARRGSRTAVVVNQSRYPAGTSAIGVPQYLPNGMVTLAGLAINGA